MKQELDIAAILKNKPKGTILWSPIMGNCKLVKVHAGSSDNWPIVVNNKELRYAYFTKNGKFCKDGEICIFPSKEMQDWEKYAWKKCELQPFDKVLVRDKEDDIWRPAFFCEYEEGSEFPYCQIGGECYHQCIPYNKETKHLLGTTDDWEGGK